MKTPLIEVKKLTKIFGKNVVLNDVDLDIPQNKIFGIIGESGSGKTSRHLSGKIRSNGNSLICTFLFF